MTSVLDSLKSLTTYPIPLAALENIAALRGLELDWEVGSTQEKDFLLAKADVLTWLSLAPNVTQEGISYSFTDKQRENYLQLANSIKDEYSEELPKAVKYGYKGTNR